MSFDWEAFKNEVICVHCRTEEAAIDFITQCRNHGLYWLYEDEENKVETNWDVYEKQSIYLYSNNRLFYGDLRYSDELEKEIIEWELKPIQSISKEKYKEIMIISEYGKNYILKGKKISCPKDLVSEIHSYKNNCNGRDIGICRNCWEDILNNYNWKE